MSDVTDTTAAAPTGLVAHIEKLFAETGDAALHGLRHLAGEVEKIARGGIDPKSIETEIEAKLALVLNPFMQQVQEMFQKRLVELEAQGQLLALKLDLVEKAGRPPLAVPDNPPAPPAPQPTAGAAATVA